MNFDEIQSLREAIKASPDSIPLRKSLANALMKNERWEEAEIEIKETQSIKFKALVKKSYVKAAIKHLNSLQKKRRKKEPLLDMSL